MKKSYSMTGILLLTGALLAGYSWSISDTSVVGGRDISELVIGTAYATTESICDCSGGSTLVCHQHQKKHGGKKDDDDEHTIRVGEAAVPAHLAHGDSLGPCEGDTKYDAEEHTDRPCVCADGSAGNLVDDPPENMKVFRQLHGE